jgi:hypothetical protein
MENDGEETIGILDGELSIDRVIVDSEVKVYRTKVVLAYLNSSVYDFVWTSFTVSNDGLVPVCSDDGRKLGFATVTRENNRIVADLCIDYASEERLMAETRSVKIYPRLRGRLTVPSEPFLDFQALIKPLAIVIEGVVLSTTSPTYASSPVLGELVL